VSGVLPASAIAVTGLAILPYHRNTMQGQFKQQVEDLRTRMKETLRKHFIEQVEDGIRRIQDNMSPYTHFVTSQDAEISKVADELEKMEKEMNTIKFDIERAFSKKE